MGILGKVMFWKRDELGLGDEIGLPKGKPADELGMEMQPLPRMPQMPMQEPRMEAFQQRQQYEPAYAYGQNKDLEIVSAKLDALKATLESINQRIANLERIAYGDDEPRKRGW